MAKRVKSGKRGLGKLLLVLVLIAAVVAGVWYVNLKMNGPSNGRQTFTFTQLVSENDTSECVHVTYYSKSYCIDDWHKVYSVMDAQNQQTSSTIGTTVTVTFDADFHTGTAEFTGTTASPTIFLDKVYSATATKQ